MSYVDGILQIEMGRQRRKIVCIMIHVMSVAYLRRSSVAATIMGYDSIAVIQEEQQLCVPVICRKRPAMTKYDGPPIAPVFVIYLTFRLWF